MANQDTNGYMNYGDDGESDFKRKGDSKKEIRDEEDDVAQTQVQSEANDYYIKELLSERVQIDGKYSHADRLLQQEMTNARQNGKLPNREQLQRYVDIYNEKPIKVTVRVTVPIKEHPKFNFVGKLLGPKGNSLRRLQEETLCKMAVMGRGSMKDRQREENLRQSLDPKYAHLNDELHVEISALAPPAEAHARIAYALAEVRKFLIPDSNDEIRQEQFRELVADGVLPPPGDEEEEEYYRGRPGPPPPPHHHHHKHRSVGGPPRSVMPTKQKVLSILDRARSAMDDPYEAAPEEDYDHVRSSYDRGYHHHMHLERAPVPSRSRPPPPPPPHEPPPPMEYRRSYYRTEGATGSSAAVYGKPPADHPPMTRRSTAVSGYPPPASRSHHYPPEPIDDHHYAPHHSHRPPPYPPQPRGERSSYRTGPYVRPPK